MGVFKQDTISKQLHLVEKNVKSSFQRIKEEFVDHLDAINENTTELQTHYEYLQQLESKIERLSEKMEQIQLLMQQQSFKTEPFLTRFEQKIFLTLYMFSEETPLSFADIAVRLTMNELAVRNCVTTLMKKGIPLVEEKIDDKSYYRLSEAFKEKQAKENVIRIDEDLLAECFPLSP